MDATATVTVVENKIHLRTEYKHKDRCKAIAGARWSPERRAWTYPASPTIAEEIIRQFRNVDTDDNFEKLIESAIRINRAQEVKEAEELPEVKNTQFKPWLHQSRAYWFARQLPAAMLAMEMGTGKTKVTVDVISNRDDIQRVLVVCPKSVISVWKKEIQKHSTLEIGVLSLYAESVKAKTEAAKCFLGAYPSKKVIIINYESVWREPFNEWALKQDWDLVVLDESHRIKSPGGAASRYCARLGQKARNRMCLTGTPMPHSPLDIYAQYRFLDPGIFGTSFTKFRDHYAVMGGYGGYEILGYKNQEEMNQKMFSIGFRASKDILDLPEFVDLERSVQLRKGTREIYNDVEADFYTEVEKNTVTAANALTKLLRLQQITSGFIKTDAGEIIPVDDGKEKALGDVLEDIPQGEPVVVFCRFQYDLNIIKKVTKDSGRRYAELSGRKNELEKWQSGEVEIIGVQIQAGGVGVDLTRSCYAIYFSLGFSLGDYEQSRARVHRPGQKRSVKYIHLITQNTVDEKVYEALSERKDVVETILELTKR